MQEQSRGLPDGRTVDTPDHHDDHDDHDGRRQRSATGTPGTAVDPVCGMSVAMVDASLHVEHDGEVVWFCGRGCMEAFLADPAAHT